MALATGTAAALHPGFVVLSMDVQSEPLFLVLLLGSGFLLLTAVDRPSSNLALLSGGLLALAALTRPSALALAPLASAPLFDRRYPLRARAHLAAAAALGIVLGLTPWTIRNAVVYRELLLVNDARGSAFYQGNSDWMVRFFSLKSPAEYAAWSQAMFADLQRQTLAVERVSGDSPAAKNRYFVAKTLQERRGEPGAWARLLLRKSWEWVRPYPNPLFWPGWVVWTTGVVYGALTVLAVIGLARAPRRGVRLFLLAYLVVTMGSHVLLIVVWRYRVPYWDPVLLLFGVFGAFVTLGGAWKRQLA